MNDAELGHLLREAAVLVPAIVGACGLVGVAVWILAQFPRH